MNEARTCVVLVASLFALLGRADSTPQELYEQGLSVLARNDFESIESSQQGVLDGAALIRDAIVAGYPDKVMALKRLAAAYLYARLWSPEDEELLAKAQDAYEEVLRLVPTDVEAAYGVVRTLPRQERQSALRKVLALDPNHVDALLDLGRSLLGTRDPEKKNEGAALLKRAAEHVSPRKAAQTRERIVRDLESHGRRSDAAEMRERYQKNLDKAKKMPP